MAAGVHRPASPPGAMPFRSVFKARSKVDTNVYAIKKVRLKPQFSYDKVLREVTALASLDHQHVVRYNTGKEVARFRSLLKVPGWVFSRL